MAHILFRRSTFCLTLVAAFAQPALAGAGDPDLDWGNDVDGRSVIPFDLGGGDSDIAVDSVVAPDGSLYIVGAVQDEVGKNRIGVVKLDPTGARDLSFSGDGRNTSLDADINPTAVALSADGNRLFVAGYRTSNAPDYDMVVCQFNANNGTNVFFPNNGNSACVSPVTFPGTQDIANDIVVQPDGRFVIAGTMGVNSPTDTYAAFARFEANGQPDNSFGNVGNTSNIALIRNTSVYEMHNVRAIARTANGRFIAAGWTRKTGANELMGLVVRLNADGTQHPISANDEYSFSRDGSATRDTLLHDIVAVDDPNSGDDAMLVVGDVELADTVFSGLLAKVGPGGSVLVAAFGEDAGSSTITPALGSVRFTDVALDGERSIVVLGQHAAGNSIDLLVRRFGIDGLPDTTFGSNGDAVVDFGGIGEINLSAGLSLLGNAAYVSGALLRSNADYDFGATKLELRDLLFEDGFEND